MFCRMRFVALCLTIMITAGLAACGSSSSSTPPDNPQQGGGGQTSPTCSPIAALEGWSGIYSACATSDGTLTKLTNTSDWEVLLLQVPAGEPVPGLDVTLGQDTALGDLVAQREFAEPIGSDYALVPPQATLTSSSSDGIPVHLDISIDFALTAQNVTAMGLVDVIQDKVNPTESEAQAIVACAGYAQSLPEQINQSQPSSPDFWNNFVNATQCYDAFNTASEAIGGGEAAVIDDAADETGDFFSDVLPELASLVAETLFH
jgi:hypothetical protein